MLEKIVKQSQDFKELVKENSSGKLSSSILLTTKDTFYAKELAKELTAMQCLPDSLAGKEYYFPTEEGAEARFKARLAEIKEWKKAHKKG